MAVDEAVLENAGQRKVLPTIRLYAWDPPCLSLGYAQPTSDVDMQVLQAHGWELVRRPTGGRAILHTDELTYSIAGPPDEPHLAGGVLESYRHLSQALLTTLHFLGLPADAHEKSPPLPGSNPQGPVCFEIPSSYEITVGGKKLVGSAQARRKFGILQHGTLPLYGDLTRITKALAFPDEKVREQAAQKLLKHATTVESALGKKVSWEETAQAMIAAFTKTLHLELIPSELTPHELERAKELARQKYSNPDWKKTKQ
jgi:lipoate-protein ligase A